MIPMVVSKIRQMSQDEGLKDPEIAMLLNMHRTTVTRARNKHNIPKANLSNRKDKLRVCTKCKKSFIIRRKDTTRICQKCQS